MNKMSLLYTTLGPKSADELGLILPHEHIFVDLRTPDAPHHGQASQEDVVRVMAPELERAREAGVAALVECTPEGVGRRVDLVKAVSQAVNFPVVVATGIYREPWVPDWARASSEDDLCAWMRRELAEGIAATGVSLQGGTVRAGFIKVSAGDDDLTPTEAKILRAAGRAGLAEGAAIGSHTIRGRVARDQLDVLDSVGFPAERFIWIHAHVEEDFALNLELARRGAWIEYDGIGWEDNDASFVERVQRMLEAGLGSRVMLSMDRGWYDPAQPGGGKPKPFTYLCETFLPKLRAAGVDKKTIRQLTVDNPFNAFGR
jgi:phosphotriesterase-related protein